VVAGFQGLGFCERGTTVWWVFMPGFGWLFVSGFF
jgi:hypothetical protein